MSYTDDFLNGLKKRGINVDGLDLSTSGDKYVQDFISGLEKRKKKKAEELVTKSDDIGPVREEEEEEEDERRWFEKGAFEDGYDFGDITKTILGSLTDARTNFTSGVLGMGESAVDSLLSLAPYMTQAQYYANGGGYNPQADEAFKQANEEGKALMSEWAKKDLYDEKKVASWLVKNTSMGGVIGQAMGVDEEDSVFGDKTDSLVQSGGQLAATAGLAYLGVPWFLTTGVTTHGSEVENALKQGAALDEANLSGLISAGAEILTEKISGGVKLPGIGKTMDDMLPSLIGSNIANKTARTVLKLIGDAGGEGLEEVLSGALSAVGQKLTYADEKELSEIFSTEDAFESFIGGAVLGGGSNVIGAVKSKAEGKDSVTGLTKDEQNVAEKILEKYVQSKGGKVSAKEKAAQWDKITTEMEKGYISAEDIEAILGGESYTNFKAEMDSFFQSDDYKAYQDAVKTEEAARKEFDPLVKMKQGEMTGEQIYRRDELKKILDESKVKELETKLSPETERIMNLRNLMRSEVFERVKGTKLEESYNELARKQQKYEVDVEQYEGKAKETVQNIIDSGLGDNSNQFHELVDFLAKISNDKGVTFNFTKTELLKGTKHYKEGYITNGFVDDNGNVVLNKDSNNAIHTIVGHEVTHVLEQTDSYKTLQAAVRDYCIAKEGLAKYNARLKAAEEAYKGKKNTTPEGEVTADIIGEYLFTDSEFVNKLSIDDRSTFEKIYDEIKYLWKVATAGSHEKRELERVKKIFDKAWRENVKGREADGTTTEDDTQYSIVKDQETIDWLENQEYLTVYKAMSLHDGKLYPPMASQEYVDEEVTLKSGKKKTKKVRKLKNPSELGKWQQAEERPDLIKSFMPPSEKYPDGYGQFDLLKSNGKTTGGVAYNPYEHTSNIVLNDQFAEAYQRPELVTVEYHIPKSELTSGYKAQYAKDPVGLTDWKAGTVATKLKNSHRDVYLTRWSKPVRVLPDSEVAQKYKELLDQEDGVSVPWNVVTPSLRTELEKLGVPIDYSVVYKGKTFEMAEAERQQDLQVLDGAPVKYSMTKDSNGRDLTTEQMEFFKDSKVVDENGSLKVMYHGTPNGDFTIFKDGTYFTDNKEYADKYQNPGASSIGSGKVVTAPKTFEVYLDIKKPFDINDAEARDIYINEYIKGGNAMGINPYLSDAEYAKIKTIDWTEGEDLRDFLIENEYDYDGLVLDEGATGGYGDEVNSRGTSWVVFSPNQVKNVDNTNPTADPDIRYSVTKAEKAKMDQDYLNAVENGDEDVVKHLVREYAKASMPDSKLVDENGNLREVYHGTNTGDFTVFNPDYIGMSSGDDGFFGMGFYFAYSKGEAAYYGANRVIPAYLNLTNPFDFEKELQTYNGERARYGHAPDAVALMNFADKFPDIAMSITLGAVKNGQSSGESISVFEFAKAFKDVIENKEFEYQELVNEYGESETLVTADPQIHEYEYNGEIHSYRDYGFQKRWYDKPNKLDVAYEYLSNAVYSYLDIPRRTRVILDNNREFTAELKRRGYDGTIQSERGDEAVAFYPHQIKSAKPITRDDDGNVIPLSKRFDSENDDIRYSMTKIEDEYMDAVNNGDTKLAEFQVEEMANIAMPDSKIRDKKGRLIPVYHGTNADFWEFDTSRDGGKNGTAEGFGIYLSDNQEVTNAYGDRQIKMYANITKPATSFKKTIKANTLVKLIKHTCETEAKRMVAEDGYDSLKDALRDTWVSNYADTYGSSMDQVYRELAHSFIQNNDNDKDIIHEVMFGMAIRSYDQAMAFYRTSLTPVTGIDGFITEWDNANTGETSTIYLAFDSSQLKSADAVTYDESGNIIPLSERFNPDKKDIRYSLSPEGKGPGYGYVPSRDIGVRDPLAEFAPIREGVAENETTTEEPTIAPDVETASAEPPIQDEENLEKEKAKLAEEFQRRREELTELLRDKNAFISNRASELYLELRGLKKGVKASDALGYLLDTGYEWSSIRSALVNIRHTPGERVNMNSAVESIARQMLNDEYEDLQYDLDDLDAEYEKQVKELEKNARKPRLTRKGLHESIVEDIRGEFARRGADFDEALKKAKNLSTFATVDNTPQRVMEKSLGYKEGGILADLTVNKVAQNETEGIKWLNTITDRKNGLLAHLSKKYHIKPGSKESAAAQMYAEGFYVNENNEIIAYGDNELAKDFPDINVQRNIKGLAKDGSIRKFYDETLAMINESRTRNLYPEIPRLENYHLHFRAMDDTFSKLGLPFNPNDIRAKDLPTDLNGVTADLKPGQPYFASAKHREGKRTSFDILGGLERYATSAKNQIFHIDDIQTLRALRNYLADTYGQANGLEGLDELTEEEAQERIKDVYNSHLSTLAKFLNEEANVLAGKTTLIDRGIEGIIGRRGITFLDTINRQVGSNAVGYSASSAIVNFDAIPRAFVKANKADFVKAFGQMVVNAVSRKSDGFAENSPVIIRRKGAERFHRTLWQKMSDPGYALMGKVDEISTELIARAKYNELTRKGMDAQKAHFETDKWVSKLMGDRSLGQQPQIFNSKMLGLLTKFQLEVRNNLDSMFYDSIQEAKVSNEHIQGNLERNARTAAKATATIAGLAIAQHIFGKAFESVAGYNPSFDIIEAVIKAFGWDDEEEEPILDNLEEAFLTVVEDMPYSSVFTGGRIPIQNALPIKELVTGIDEYGNEKSRWETLGEIAPYYLMPGGYGQIKKTVQGLGMFLGDHPIDGSYTDSGKLRFPVEDHPLAIAQAALFGQYASKNARDYFDNDWAPLAEKQITEYSDLGMDFKQYHKIRDGLKDYDTLAEKVDYIYGLDISDEQKNILVNNLTDRKTPIDMSNYGEYGSFEEFDYAQKNPDKYEFFKGVGISYDDYASADEEGKREYSSMYEWVKDNPGKYEMSKAISDDFLTYWQYKGEMGDLKADKDSDGKTISGSKKEKVIDYINNLDLDYGQKIILFRSMYDSQADREAYNSDILEYLNSRDDISYEEMVTILTELGFKVNGNQVTWD